MAVLRWITYRAFCPDCGTFGGWVSEARWDKEKDAKKELAAHDRAMHKLHDSGRDA